MRLFIGIALAQEATDTLRRVRDRLAPAGGELRWSAEESWHVTLQFLGAASAEEAACVMEQLGEVRSAPVPMRLDGVGFFERAGVFHAGVDLTPGLLALQQRVTAATRQCGFLPEERAYHPHITLPRAKGRHGPGALAPLKKALEKFRLVVHAEFLASEFLLYESIPRPEGSRYQVRARFPLTAEEAP